MNKGVLLASAHTFSADPCPRQSRQQLLAALEETRQQLLAAPAIAGGAASNCWRARQQLLAPPASAGGAASNCWRRRQQLLAAYATLIGCFIYTHYHARTYLARACVSDNSFDWFLQRYRIKILKKYCWKSKKFRYICMRTVFLC